MTKFLGRSVALAMLSAAIALTLLVAAALIALQLVGSWSTFENIRCQLGISAGCPQQELEEKKRQLHSLAERYAELMKLYDRLAKLDYASESFVVFYQNSDDRHSVMSGHRYASLIEPGQFRKGWCYIDLPDDQGLSRDLFIADVDAEGKVTRRQHDADALEAVGLTAGDVDQALTLCKWPETTR